MDAWTIAAVALVVCFSCAGIAGVVALSVWLHARSNRCDWQPARWDRWLARLPSMRLDARVLLVTLCTPNYDHIGKYAVSFMRRYAAAHSYDLLLQRASLDATIAPHYSKPLLISRLLASARVRASYDQVLLLDADMAFNRLDMRVADLLQTSTNPRAALHLARDCSEVPDECTYHSHFNTGCILLNLKQADALQRLYADWNLVNKKEAGTHMLKDQAGFEKLRATQQIRVEVGTFPCYLVGTNVSKVFQQAYMQNTGKETWIKAKHADQTAPDLPAHDETSSTFLSVRGRAFVRW
jgi:hypothetical protein